MRNNYHYLPVKMEHKWHNPVDTELLASVLSSWSSQERGEGETLLQSLVMMILRGGLCNKKQQKLKTKKACEVKTIFFLLNRIIF